MVIVVDTNVFLGACLGRGMPAKVVELCIQGTHVPLFGTTLLTEYEAVLSRHALFRKSRLSRAEREELLDIFLASARWTRIYYGWRPNLPDEADNHLVELAVAGNASYIVTRNLRDLRPAKLQFPNIAVVSPDRFVEVSA